ncbi:hypothetical protein AVEN_172625-1 [Araneus ventricosus]|uniref:Uncharacterized protein n=1 Tax=Araneus ventricosus TaxID=182803 RepID=A0A4Y2RKL1_ARAVE|nr:hypothetical protein AVEN_172625-1 [Araneus ventricosus]
MDNIYLCRKSANEGDINVELFAGGRKECHLANEDPDQYINGRISFVGRSGELDFTYAGERQVCFESRLGSTPIRDCEF